jgi:dTDP-D-glucose 4,6-dehydratase
VKRSVLGTASSWQKQGVAHTSRELRRRRRDLATDEVFGALGICGQVSEATPYDPRSPYAATKAASDHLVRAWAETFGLPTLVTNCSNNYGPFHFPEKLVPVAILNASRRPIPSTGGAERARLALRGGPCGGAPDGAGARAVGRTYAIGAEAEARNIDLVRRVCALLDEMRPAGAPHERLIAFVTDRPGHDARYAIDPSRIARSWAGGPSSRWRRGCRRTRALVPSRTSLVAARSLIGRGWGGALGVPVGSDRPPARALVTRQGVTGQGRDGAGSGRGRGVRVLLVGRTGQVATEVRRRAGDVRSRRLAGRRRTS